jgi:hypothetical protein
MSNIGKVLLIGDPTDEATQVLDTQCREAGCKVFRWTDYQIYDLPLNEGQDVIIYNYPAHLLADQVFARNLVRGHSVILLNTLSDWAVGKLLPEHEGQVLGFSPLGLYHDRKTLELGRTLRTSDTTCELAQVFFTNMGLKTHLVTETPGFVFPRILAMLVNEAVSAVMEGVATPEDIDTAMTLGTNYPIGPLAWADAVGLDVILEILENLHGQLGEDRYRPMPLLTQKVLAGHLGKKAGQGFYTYPATPAPATASV